MLFRSGGPVAYIGAFVPRTTKNRFERARLLASRKAGRMLDRAETLTTLVDHYLERNDPMFLLERKRRRRKFARASDSIPEVEKRKVRGRFRDRCALDTCTNGTFLDFAHIRPRARGGANRSENLLQLCKPHHRQFDAGAMFLRYPGGGQRPVFVDRQGRRVAGLRPPPAEAEGEDGTGPP